MSSPKSSDIPPLQSDDTIMSVLKESNQYLDAQDEMVWKLFTTLRVFNDVGDLIPQTVERLFTNHMFPLFETGTALESSIQFCKMGFYKQAFTELRNVLELGLLSVYWELDDDGHIKMQDWLHSHERTPKMQKIIAKLTTNHNIKTFDDKHGFCDRIKTLYDELSGFTHTRGAKHSHQRLSRSNVNRFNEKSMSKYLGLLFKVVNVVVIAYVLKYPVSLQHTPLYQKFGLNSPAGGFLDVDQSEALRRFLDGDVLKTLQAISDSDDYAVRLAQWVKDRPDLTPEQEQQQMNQFYKEHPEMKPPDPDNTVRERDI